MKMPWEADGVPYDASVETNMPNGPLTPAPRIDDSKSPSTPVSEPALDALSKSRPDLVAAYRAKMAGSDQSLKDAQGAQDMGNYGNVAGKVLTDFGNSQKKDVILGNRMQDLGKAPPIVKADRPAYDPSEVNSITQQGVDRAKQQRTTALQDFGEETALTDEGDKRADADLARGDASLSRARAVKSNDPASPESAAAREYLKQVAPSAASIANFDKLTEAQAYKMAPELLNARKADEANETRKDVAATRAEEAHYHNGMLAAAGADRAEAKKSQAGEAAYTKASVLAQGGRGAPPDVLQATKDRTSVEKINKAFAEYPELDKMPSAQVNNVIDEIQKLATGGQGTESGRKGQDPDTLAQRWAHFQQMVGNKPTGADLGAFLSENKKLVDGYGQQAQGVLAKHRQNVYKGARGSFTPAQDERWKDDHPEDFQAPAPAAASAKPLHGADLP